MAAFRQLVELAYPAEFSFEHLNSIKTFKGRMAYVQQTLGKHLGRGSSRVVFPVDNEKVLKVAMNHKGILQNERESLNYVSPLTAETFEVSPDHLWIEMERVVPFTKSRFKQATGFSQEDLWNLLAHEAKRADPRMRLFSPRVPVVFQVKYPGFDPRADDHPGWSEAWDNEFLYDLFSFLANAGLWGVWQDYAQAKHYGLNARGEIRLIDFGVDDEVMNVYVQGRRGAR